MMLPTAPDCTAFSLGLLECGLFETVMGISFSPLRMYPWIPFSIGLIECGLSETHGGNKQSPIRYVLKGLSFSDYPTRKCGESEDACVMPLAARDWSAPKADAVPPRNSHTGNAA